MRFNDDSAHTNLSDIKTKVKDLNFRPDILGILQDF